MSGLGLIRDVCDCKALFQLLADAKRSTQAWVSCFALFLAFHLLREVVRYFNGLEAKVCDRSVLLC